MPSDLEESPAKPSEATKGPAPAGRKRDGWKKWLLALLLVCVAVFGGRAWRVYAGMLECERLFAVADGQMHANQWDDAMSTLDRCILLNPLYYPAYEARYTIQLDVHKDPTAALATLQEATRHIDDDSRVHHALATYYGQIGDYPKALAEARRACDLEPTNLTWRGTLRKLEAEAARKS